MPSAHNPRIGRARAVLFVGPSEVEWYEEAPEGEPVHGSAPIQGPGPGDVAAAAAGLLRRLGRPPRDCVLVLADELLSEKVVHLPVLPPRERRLALRRKAANLVGKGERSIVFGALLLGLDARGDERTEAALHKWLLFAADRSRLGGLALALRRRGIGVRRAVPARLTSLGHRALAEGQSPAVRAVVGIGSRCAVLSLVQGDSLVHQTLLAGSLGASSSLGATLVQELRGLDLFWRKASRGASIDEVVLIGIEANDSIQLAPAIHAALPGIRARLLPVPDPTRPAAGRVEALAAALEASPFDLDLSVPLPPRPRAVAALTVGLGLIAAAAGVVGLERLESRRQEWLSAAGALHQATQDLPALVRERSERERGLERLHARHRRLEALERLGLPLEAILLEVGEAFGGRGTLETLAVTRGPLGLKLDATGETSGDPVRGFTALHGIRQALEAHPRYREVELLPPPTLPERAQARDRGRGTLTFALRATLEVPR